MGGGSLVIQKIVSKSIERRGLGAEVGIVFIRKLCIIGIHIMRMK